MNVSGGAADSLLLLLLLLLLVVVVVVVMVLCPCGAKLIVAAISCRFRSTYVQLPQDILTNRLVVGVVVGQGPDMGRHRSVEAKLLNTPNMVKLPRQHAIGVGPLCQQQL